MKNVFIQNKTKSIHAITISIAVSILTACGGSNDSTFNSKTYYYFMTPAVSYMRSYNITSTPNNPNVTTPIITRETVTAVNADGSFIKQVAPAILVAGAPPISETLDATGHVTSTTTSNNDGGPSVATMTICDLAPHQGGAAFPLFVGKTWDFSYTSNCTTKSSTTKSTILNNFTDIGSVVGVESVTVPAGTFNTVKLHYTVTNTSTVTGASSSIDNITTWLDTKNGYPVKSIDVQTTNNNNPTTPSTEITTTKELQSQGILTTNSVSVS